MTASKLLQRQLRRAGVTADQPPTVEQWRTLLESVDRTYTAAEQDRYTTERSLAISSQEMRALYDDLKRSSESRLATERDKLKKTVAIHEAILESALDGVLVVDEHDRVIAYSERFVELWQIPLGEVDVRDDEVRRSVVAAKHVDPAAFTARLATIYSLKHEPSRDDFVLRDGRTINSVSAPIRDDEGTTHGRVWFFRDITAERAAAANTLQASEDRHRILFDASPHPIWVFDPQTLRVLGVNDAFVDIIGYSREELLAMSVLDLKLQADGPRLVNGMRQRALGGTYHVGTQTYRCKDRRLVELDITSHGTMLDGNLVMLALGVDVTHSRKIEEQLRQSQKMEAIGQLAGGVAHDFNNILAAIMGSTELAIEEVGEDHPVVAELKEVEAAAERAATLTRQLLTFSRQQRRQVAVVAVNSLVTNIEKMLVRIVGEDIEMSAILAPHLGSVEADPGQLEQVLMNLVVNARDAMPTGGRLSIATSNADLDATQASQLGLEPGQCVVLEVSDNGTGMDAATQARIFEPFFTTKGVGKGTGLGLSTVFGIVKQSGGAISVSSELGRGSTFRVHLPRIRRAAEPAASPTRKAVIMAGGMQRICLVEDDEGLRRVLGRQLRSWGYDLIEARNASAALELLQQTAEPVHLLLTDLVMPGLDGRALASQVLAGRPETKVLFMSGYTEHSAVKTAAFADDDRFIAKPFTSHDLSTAIRHALDATPRLRTA